MNNAEQLDLACLLSQHWSAVVDAYPAGFPTVVSAELASHIEALRAIGAVDNKLKLAGRFKAIVMEVANGRDLSSMETVDLEVVSSRHAEWYQKA